MEKRNVEMDFFRGIGILLMIFVHVGFGNKIYRFVHAFHMPMFFFIAGWFYKTNDLTLRDKLQKEFKKLLVPYMVFGIYYWFLDVIWNAMINQQTLINLFFINTDELSVVGGGIWFLTAMFIATVLYFLIFKIKNELLKGALITILSVFGAVAKMVLPYRLPWAMDAAFVGVGLMYIGHLSRVYFENKVMRFMLNLNIPYITAFGCVVTLLIMKNGTINMRRGNYGFIAIFWINAIAAIFIGISLSKVILRITKNTALESIADVICRIGKNSISYLCMNQVFIFFWNNVLYSYLDENVITSIAVFLLTVCSVWIVDSVIRKNPALYFLIGGGVG